MKLNVITAILLFCCGIVFAFMFMRGNHDHSDEASNELGDQGIDIPMVYPAFIKDNNITTNDSVKWRHDVRINQGNTVKLPGNGHNSDKARSVNDKPNSNTAHKGMSSLVCPSAQSEILITRNRHTTRTTYVPVTRERTIEKNTQSYHVIDRLVVETPDGASLVDSAATTSIADPVNPKPGMLFKGYSFSVDAGDLQSKLTDKVPARTTMVTKADSFSIDGDPNKSGVWEGFLKCKYSAKCTILVERNNGNCNLFVNGKSVAKLNNDGGNCVGYVDMKVGWNHIKLFVSYGGHVSVSLKLAESTKEPKPFSPKDLFYDTTAEMAEEVLL